MPPRVYPTPQTLNEYLLLARVWIVTQQPERATSLISALAEITERHALDPLPRLLLQTLAANTRKEQTTALQFLERALTHAAPRAYLRALLEAGAEMRDLLTTFKTRLRATDSTSAETLRAYCDALLFAFARAAHAETYPAQSLPPLSIADLYEPLTEREREVLQLVAQGRSNLEICDALSISLGATKKHLTNIFAKLQVATRTQAVRRAQELGLV